MAKNIIELVNQEEVKEALLTAVTLDSEGRLEENADNYREIKDPVFYERYLSLEAEHFFNLSVGIDRPAHTLNSIPLNIFNDKRYLIYCDYPSAFFYTHRIILVTEVSYKITPEGDVLFNPSDLNVEPIAYDSRQHGKTLNLITDDMIKNEGRKVGSVLVSIDGDSVMGTFVLLVKFVELTGAPEDAISESRLLERVVDIHGEYIGRSINEALTNIRPPDTN